MFYCYIFGKGSTEKTDLTNEYVYLLFQHPVMLKNAFKESFQLIVFLLGKRFRWLDDTSDVFLQILT